ncbi:MAG: ABC transporter permease [Sphaerobacteraceae bacterium]|nr:MAG: ABC transporter permease [Sphaerobacteraceae bacterium]
MNVRTALRRILAMIPALIGASIIAFALGVVAPGDPAYMALSQSATGEPRPEAVQELRAEWGLDDPVPIQYVKWVGRVLQGDLGVSYYTGSPVTEELMQRLPATLNLALVATAMAVMVGISTGVLSAVLSGGALDGALRVSTVFLASLPGFLVGLILILVFAEILGIMPTSGYGTWKHTVLPAVALATGPTAQLLRVTRTQMIDVLGQDYMRTARAKGLAQSMVVLQHGLRNTLINTLTVVGLYLAAILGGAAIIETVFAWPGIGRLAVDSITRRDYPVVQGFVLLAAGIYVLVNFVVDVLYSVIDPRVRAGE